MHALLSYTTPHKRIKRKCLLFLKISGYHEEMNSLEDVLAHAEQASKPPPLPDDLPKQRLPKSVRYLLLSLLLPLLLIDLCAETIAKKIIRTPFIRTGACKRRGNCCHYLLFHETPKWIRWLFTFWSEELHGFFYRGYSYEHEGKTIRVMGCRYLRSDGSCGNYRLRPKVCRTWPIVALFGRPKILKGCGYQVKLRDSYRRKYPKLRVMEDEFH